METEKKLVEYILDAKFEDLPDEPVDVIKSVMLTIVGTTLAGATEEGCEAVLNQVREWGGKEEATILIHGGKVPAYNAVLVNSIMARAHDFCDANEPGMHVGSSSVPTALAAAELAGGCSGKEFLNALIVGTEIANRINLCSDYDGFDPTGVCSIFASTTIAAKILGLNSEQVLNALALAFSRSGGSLQTNIDGSLGARFIQGSVSQSGIISTQLARRGMTGPKNFIEGTYGYYHLFCKDKYDTQAVTGQLGARFELTKTKFKRYPSCGLTQGPIAAILDLVIEKGINPEDIDHIHISVPPFAYSVVGQPFQIGHNPKVNAQFSIQYCVASALIRKDCKLSHFQESYVREPKIVEFAQKVHITGDPALDKRGMSAIDMQVRTRRGDVYYRSMDIAPGSPGNPLTREDHMARFQECVSYASRPLPKEHIEKLTSLIDHLEEVEDVRSLIPLLISQKAT